MAGTSPELKYPSVGAFFSGRSILITGATGFMGKILLEKLLRCCPDIDTMYLLMRQKKGKEPNSRLEEITSCMIFAKLRAQSPEVLTKLQVVSGDVSEQGLGLSPESRALLLERVSVVFHCAACVRFDMKLRQAMTFNTMGTKRVLELCKDMALLESFVYVSTSYCHCDRDVLGEEAYPPPNDPYQVITCLEWMDDSMLETLTPKLLGNLPNTYAYSKSLSESLVTDASKFMPVAIARPSIVTAVYREPLPGWVDNMNGPTGLMVGAGKGVIRSMHCRESYLSDMIPVDVACNGLITTAWHLANQRPVNQPLVVNLTSSELNPVTWGEMLLVGRKYLQEYPLSDSIWYPDGSFKNSRFWHDVSVLFFHTVPAYIIDFLLVAFRQKPFMVRVQQRISGGLEMLQYYTIKEWCFVNQNIGKIERALPPADQETFYTDVSKVDWRAYMLDVILGMRNYLLKEDPANLPAARRRNVRLYWLDRGVQVLMYIAIFWMLYSSLDTLSSVLDGMSSVLGQISRPLLGVSTEDTSSGHAIDL